jgi:uncharacterized protein
MNTGSGYALVTGASSGIGWHLARELARRGYSIAAVSNQPAQLEALRRELTRDFGVRVFLIETDLARQDAARHVYDVCEQNRLEVQVLANNAGVLLFGEAVRVGHLAAEQLLQHHVVTPALLCRLFGEKMLHRRSGYILNVSSISAVMPYPYISLYGPSKAFLRSFSRALRTEMKPLGVGVTCLLPGATATGLYDPQAVNIPLMLRLRVMQKPERVAEAGIRALFAGRAEAIPGFFNKIIVILLPWVPHNLISLIHRHWNQRD